MPLTTIDDVEIHYLHRQPSTPGGQRVLYVHGTGCDARVFERHLAVIGARHEVAAIDLPGHGRSGGRGFRGVADYGAFCAGLIEALGWSDCVVAGHSLGGGVALAVALYDAALVRALLLVDTGARLRVAPQIIRAARAAAAAGRRATGNPRLGFADSTPDSVVEAVRELTADCDPDVVMRDWIADDTCDFMHRLKDIDRPALALCGREDVLTPLKYHLYLREHLPRCSLSILDDCGHWPFFERPEVFDAEVGAFLDGLG